MKRTTRGIIIFPSELTRRSVRQIIESGLDAVGIHAAFTDSGKNCVQNLIDLLKNEEFKKNLQMLRSAGIVVEYELHAMDWLLPHTAFDQHPEWFRMNDAGVRKADFNFCPSNQEALTYVEEKAQELAKLLPSPQSHRFYFWIDDNGEYCHCPQCQGLNASDQALIVYNHILKGIRKSDPQGKQCYLAYQKTIQAPQRIKPDAGIFLEYAPIDRMSGLAINDLRCEKNIGQKNALGGLLRVFGTKDSQVLEYWLDLSRFYAWKPPFGELPFYPHVIRQDVVFYRSIGFERMTSFACRLMEDEYINCYGEAPIKQYVDLLG